MAYGPAVNGPLVITSRIAPTVVVTDRGGLLMVAEYTDKTRARLRRAATPSALHMARAARAQEWTSICAAQGVPADAIVTLTDWRGRTAKVWRRADAISAQGARWYAYTASWACPVRGVRVDTAPLGSPMVEWLTGLGFDGLRCERSEMPIPF